MILKTLRQSYAALLMALLLHAGSHDAAAQSGITISGVPSAITMTVSGAYVFSPVVTGAANPALNWTLKGSPQFYIGGFSNGGPPKIIYWAPVNVPTGGVVTVTATSAQDPTVSVSCVVTIKNATPVITAVTPNPVPLGAFTLSVKGTSFGTGAQVFFNGNPLPTTVVSTTQLTASGVATAADIVNPVVTVTNPGPVTSTPYAIYAPNGVWTAVVSISSPSNITSLQPNGTLQLQAAVTGVAPNASTGVAWSVLGVNDGTLGSIDQTGLYTAAATPPASGVVKIQAAALADPTKTATTAITILDPVLIHVGRFLAQSSIGPTAQSISDARQRGVEAYLAAQFALPESTYPDPATSPTPQAICAAFVYNLANGQDQLRQRVVYALSQHFVVSFSKDVTGQMVGPWLQILSKDAFGNFRTLLHDITLSPAMGLYLDLGNSNKPTKFSGANENYARELMQLFTIGLYHLNQDGSLKLYGGSPAITFDQNAVHNVALALTGWTFPTAPGQAYQQNNFGAWGIGQMETRDINHDMTGVISLLLPDGTPAAPVVANQTTALDSEKVLDLLFNHPNVGPFIAVRLIRSLVTSNPSPGYISRVAGVFNDDGTGVRGNLQAVITAILLDAEARNDASADQLQGKLRSPLLHTLGLMRALNMPVAANNAFGSVYASMGESLLNATSVFAHYSPMFQVPNFQVAGQNMCGPEFQIFSAAEAVNRMNWIYQLLCNADLSAYTSIAADPATLVSAVDRTLLFGRMSAFMRQTLITAAQATPDLRTRVLTVLYLTATDAEYLIQR
jgi:uncharacterized protein (DUF1800 family)